MRGETPSENEMAKEGAVDLNRGSVEMSRSILVAQEREVEVKWRK